MSKKPRIKDESELVRALGRYRRQLCADHPGLEDRLVDGKMERCRFGTLIDRFDLILFDAYGVLNRPTVPIEGAAMALERVRQSGTPFLVVSNNSSDRPEGVRRKLQDMGISLPLSQIVTSGMAVKPFIADSPYRDRPYLLIGTPDSVSDYAPDPERLLVNPLEGPPREDIEPAFVLICSNMTYYGSRHQTLIEERLSRGALPLLLANPDVVVESDQRVPSVVAGYTTDQLLLRFGGVLVGIGKPFPPIYRLAMQCYPSLPPERILMVGDALTTDILGGATMGFATCLTLSGLHGHQSREIESVCRAWAIQPDFVVDSIGHGMA